MRKSGIVEPKTRPRGGVKSDRAKPRGNPTIGADSSSGVAAVLQQKIRDAERVLPIIAHLVSHKGCSSYRQVADALNYLEVETPRNKGWHPTSVKNAMATTGVTFLSLLGTPARDQQPGVEGLPVRPNRSERHAVRHLYGLHGKPRAKSHPRYAVYA